MVRKRKENDTREEKKKQRYAHTVVWLAEKKNNAKFKYRKTEKSLYTLQAHITF